MEIKMTDDLFEFRNYIIKDLIDRGYKYIARDRDGAIFAFSRQPIKRGDVWGFDMTSNDDKMEDISIVSRMFTDIKWEDKKPFEILCVNWDSVPVDTNVMVTGVDDSEWKCHFCKKLNDNSILVFRDGKTSWTTNDVIEVDIDRVRLA